MIILPILAALLALGCAGIVGWDALKRPRPERVTWAIAFLVFAVAAGAEVAGSALGWTPILARVYYLAGAVLVVGLLALGELYLLVPGRMPAVAPGMTLLVIAVAATTVWSAPVDAAALQTHGWDAIERGPMLVALAASINAGGTVVLAGGALYSAWRLRDVRGMRARAVGCLLIGAGAVIVAAGGTLTRFGQREFLYLAMSLGVAVIFGGVVLTRRAPGTQQSVAAGIGANGTSSRETRLIPFPVRHRPAGQSDRGSAGLIYICEFLLPLEDDEIAGSCRRWSASSASGDTLSRDQARQVWALRTSLPEHANSRFDRLPLQTQAQLAELFSEVWSAGPTAEGARRA